MFITKQLFAMFKNEKLIVMLVCWGGGGGVKFKKTDAHVHVHL